MRVTMKAARTNADLTLDDAANALNISVQTLINWEKGRSEPVISQAYKLATLYGADINDIIFFESESDLLG